MFLDCPDLGMRLLLQHASIHAGGLNHAPALSWGNVPSDAKSLALIMHDPDAPTGGMGFVHWLVPYLPVDLTGLEEGANVKMPQGVVELDSDYGEKGYGGPCPPQGREHRYIITLYALNTSFADQYDDLAKISRAYVGFQINAAAINRSTKELYYKR